MIEMVFLNGKLVPRGQAWISPWDHGFLYGYGLFETMRAYQGRVFRQQAHLDRLARGAAELSLPFLWSPAQLAEAIQQTLAANGLSDARIRLTLSLGEGEMGPSFPAPPQPTLLIAAFPFTPPLPQVYERGFRAITASFRRHSQSPLSHLKSLNYLENLLARRESRSQGVDEALLLNEKGFLCEATTANLFLVIGDRLLTPPVESGALPGITRQVVLELAPQVGFKPEATTPLTPADLRRCQESFLTNSLLEIMPLTQVDGQKIGSGTRGEITQKLTMAYRERVVSEVGGHLATGL